MQPIVEAMMQETFEQLIIFEKEIADQYIAHLKELIAEKTEQKDVESAKLSKDEQLLQEDNDWLTEFADQLNVIERG